MVTKYAEPTKHRTYDKVVDFFHNYEHDPTGLTHCIGSPSNPYHIHHVRITGLSNVQHVIDLAYARGHGLGNEPQWFHFASPLRGGHWLERGEKVSTPAEDKWKLSLFQKPGGGKQRLGSGDWEQATNRQQRRLTRAFDEWSARTRRALTNAASRGISIPQQTTILDNSMAELEAKLAVILEVGSKSAARISAGKRADIPQIKSVVENHDRENRALLATALIPVIFAKLLPEVARGVASDPKLLQTAFGSVRAAPGQYAGRAWVLIFETQQELGSVREAERRSQGLTVEPVRWVLDPRAEHCVASPGHYGCPDLAGEYKGGWSTLKTVPAGLTTCRGNCRCHVEVYRDGKWQRGVYDD